MIRLVNGNQRIAVKLRSVPVIRNRDYAELHGKPRINNVELMGNRSLDDLDIQRKGEYVEDEDYLTNAEIENMINNFV